LHAPHALWNFRREACGIQSTKKEAITQGGGQQEHHGCENLHGHRPGLYLRLTVMVVDIPAQTDQFDNASTLGDYGRSDEQFTEKP
jgi:hypothetical protein